METCENGGGGGGKYRNDRFPFQAGFNVLLSKFVKYYVKIMLFCDSVFTV
jgi:hypothetical protein